MRVKKKVWKEWLDYTCLLLLSLTRVTRKPPTLKLYLGLRALQKFIGSLYKKQNRNWGWRPKFTFWCNKNWQIITSLLIAVFSLESISSFPWYFLHTHLGADRFFSLGIGVLFGEGFKRRHSVTIRCRARAILDDVDASFTYVNRQCPQNDDTKHFSSWNAYIFHQIIFFQLETILAENGMALSLAN